MHAPLSDPGGPPGPGLYGPWGVAFHLGDGVGTHDFAISGLNHAAYMLAVYASQRRSPDTTQDSLRLGGHPLPAGLQPAGFHLEVSSLQALT
jgi:hypothetical protein